MAPAFHGPSHRDGVGRCELQRDFEGEASDGQQVVRREESAGQVDHHSARAIRRDGLGNQAVHAQGHLRRAGPNAADVSGVLGVDAAELIQHRAQPIVDEDILALGPGDSEREPVEQTRQMPAG